MNALSSIRTILPSELSPLPLPKTGAQPVTPAPIPFSELKELGSASQLQPLSPTGEASSFGSVLGRLVSEVNDKQAVAGEAVKGLINGQGVSLHQAMISMEEASVSFQLMVEVRNKLLESYQELMRMQM